MQVDVKNKSATKHNDKCFSKRWWIFYVFTALMATGIIFLWLSFFRSNLKITALDAITFVCITAIFLAIFLQIKGIFSVEIFGWGVSYRQMGKFTKTYWDEISSVTYGAGITLNAGKKNIVVNPSIFQNSKEIYVFIEKKLAHLQSERT